jgi:hypothetical protein
LFHPNLQSQYKYCVYGTGEMILPAGKRIGTGSQTGKLMRDRISDQKGDGKEKKEEINNGAG